jgi:hypothetical protein
MLPSNLDNKASECDAIEIRPPFVMRRGPSLIIALMGLAFLITPLLEADQKPTDSSGATASAIFLVVGLALLLLSICAWRYYWVGNLIRADATGINICTARSSNFFRWEEVASYSSEPIGARNSLDRGMFLVMKDAQGRELVGWSVFAYMPRSDRNKLIKFVDLKMSGKKS